MSVPRAMARRTFFTSGLAALEMVSGRAMGFLYNVQIRITQMKRAVGIVAMLAVFALLAAVGYISLEIARQSTMDVAAESAATPSCTS